MQKVYTFRIMVRHSERPGSGFGWATTTATSAHEALQFFKSLYGRKLLNEVVQVVR